jgi:hypothetical protein
MQIRSLVEAESSRTSHQYQLRKVYGIKGGGCQSLADRQILGTMGEGRTHFRSGMMQIRFQH